MNKKQSKLEIVDYFKHLEILTAETRQKINNLDESDEGFSFNLTEIVLEFNEMCKKLGGQS